MLLTLQLLRFAWKWDRSIKRPRYMQRCSMSYLIASKIQVSRIIRDTRSYDVSRFNVYFIVRGKSENDHWLAQRCKGFSLERMFRCSYCSFDPSNRLQPLLRKGEKSGHWALRFSPVFLQESLLLKWVISLRDYRFIAKL